MVEQKVEEEKKAGQPGIRCDTIRIEKKEEKKAQKKVFAIDTSKKDEEEMESRTIV